MQHAFSKRRLTDDQNQSASDHASAHAIFIGVQQHQTDTSTPSGSALKGSHGFLKAIRSVREAPLVAPSLKK